MTQNTPGAPKALPSPAPKRVPLGRALVRTDADLDRLSEITFDDFDAVRAEATPEMRELLDAPSDEGDGGKP